MPKAAVTRILPDAGMDILRRAESAGEVELAVWPDELPPDQTALAELLHGCDGAITLVTDPIGPELLDAEPQLKVISNFAVGFDNIDVAAATERGVTVCNTPGVLTETTADLAWALLMAAARRVVLLADSSKHGQEHFARFGDLSDVDLLITDSGLGPDDAAAIEHGGTEVVRA